MSFSLDHDHRKAEAWVAGELGSRGAYTQVRLEPDVARIIGQMALAEHISLAEAARRLIQRGIAT